MRTARPFVTCSRITERPQSAISLSISTPRLIGPGCMIIASGLVRANRSLFSPNIAVYSPMLGNIVWRWRSCWMRSRLITSASRIASSMSCVTRQPNSSNTRGTSVDGPPA